jgi:hypothetical protein
VVCGILGPFAWVKGNRALAEMDRDPNIAWSNRGNIRAGQICGIVSSCLIALSAVIVFLALVIAVGSSS